MPNFSTWSNSFSQFQTVRRRYRTAALSVAMVAAAATAHAQVAEVTVGPDGLAIEPLVAVDSLTVTASGPGGVDVMRTYPGGGTAVFLIFDDNGDVLPDGSYSYQVTGAPALDPDTRAAMAACREAADCDSLAAALRASGALPDPAEMVLSGSFTIDAGYVVLADQGEGEPAGTANLVPPNDQVFLDDVIMQFSLCVGNDCVNGENFGFDTIRLKENNLRIHFQDTSNTASFPTTDWRIVINDSGNGGANYFRVEEATTATSPFTIEAGAGNNALVVDSTGRVGFGTNSPVTDLHPVSGNTPTLRLEQDGSSGFAPQTWDMAGNEAGFFVRDATNGSTLPFRILPGAASESLVIADDDNIGIGTLNPSASLEVVRNDGTAQIKVVENNSTVDNRFVFELENNGPPRMRFTNTNTGAEWWYGPEGTIGATADRFVITRPGTGGGEFNIFRNGRIIMGRPSGGNKFDLATNGNLTIAGTLTENSDISAKRDVQPVDGDTILTQVAELPVSTWSYKDDKTGARHVGPMAQDFHAAFGLGANDTTLAPRDVAGVALAAVKQLEEIGRQKDRRIEALEAELERRVTALEALEARLNALEARLSRLDQR